METSYVLLLLFYCFCCVGTRGLRIRPLDDILSSSLKRINALNISFLVNHSVTQVSPGGSNEENKKKSATSMTASAVALLETKSAKG